MDIELVRNITRTDIYYYNIILKSNQANIGYIELRPGHSKSLYYYGNIGYRILQDYRGHGYAGLACKILLEMVKDMDFDYLLITVSPENIASVKTIERLPFKYMETVNVPFWHPLYHRNEKVKMIYRYDIER